MKGNHWYESICPQVQGGECELNGSCTNMNVNGHHTAVPGLPLKFQI